MALVVRTHLPMQETDIREAGGIPESGRFPGGGNDNPLQYLAWRIPRTEEPGGPQSTGCKESDATEAT